MLGNQREKIRRWAISVANCNHNWPTNHLENEISESWDDDSETEWDTEWGSDIDGNIYPPPFNGRNHYTYDNRVNLNLGSGNPPVSRSWNTVGRAPPAGFPNSKPWNAHPHSSPTNNPFTSSWGTPPGMSNTTANSTKSCYDTTGVANLGHSNRTSTRVIDRHGNVTTIHSSASNLTPTDGRNGLPHTSRVGPQNRSRRSHRFPGAGAVLGGDSTPDTTNGSFSHYPMPPAYFAAGYSRNEEWGRRY